MESSSPLNRAGSVPAIRSEHPAESSSTTASHPVEAAREIGQQYLNQDRKSHSFRSVLTRFTNRTDTRLGIQIEQLGEQQSPHLSPHFSPQRAAQTTWTKIQGKAGCLLGEAARAACGLDSPTLKAATETANLLNCVIAIRSVASGAVDAMKNGAVPKGLPIKGKSSNFGPQNALIPRDPRLSKKWNDTANIEDARTKTETALASGEIKSTPMQLDSNAIANMVKKGLIAVNLDDLVGQSTTIELTAVNSLSHPTNPAALFRLSRTTSGVGVFTGDFTDTFPDTFTVEYSIKLSETDQEPWKPLEVLANEDLKPYTADFDLFTVMPKTDSPLLIEELDNYKKGARELEEKFALANPDEKLKGAKKPQVFDFAGVVGLDAPSPKGSLSSNSASDTPKRRSSGRTSITRSPLPLTPQHLYTPKGPKEEKSTSRLALNMSKLQLAAKTVVSMLARSERSTFQPDVGKESYWESQVRKAFNTAHKSLTKIQVNPVKHGNEQNNPKPEPVENITFIKPNGEIWFAENEPAAMAMIYMAREEGHLGYLNKEYAKERYDSGVELVEGLVADSEINPPAGQASLSNP